ncbi:unnamed protein product [Owenia fusiformis]|uniref:Uncharacterized protein n=1 Tax=Owenia fusiformis TaxID=6347 RepID=A0A8J1U9B6_OWEFU|nr:unnamed protein product [Owenia fusiformis]
MALSMLCKRIFRVSLANSMSRQSPTLSIIVKQKIISNAQMVDSSVEGHKGRRWLCTESNEHGKHRHCWKCKRKLDELEVYFCKCGIIQPLDSDWSYFEIMGTPQQFDIDTNSLTKHYRGLQKHLHPDKYSQKSDLEREYSEAQSSIVNKAYNTLLKPLSRGLYLLELHGETIEEDQIEFEPDFLMDIMEVNETLANSADNADTVRLIQKENRKIINGFIVELTDAFANENIKKAKELLSRLKYYANIDEKVKQIQRDKGYMSSYF